jgi:hypothetical protein
MGRRPFAKPYLSGLLVRIEIALKGALHVVYVSTLSKFMASIDGVNTCRKKAHVLASVASVLGTDVPVHVRDWKKVYM